MMVLAEVFPGCSFVSSRKTQGVVNNTSLMRRADQAWGGIRCQKIMLAEVLPFVFLTVFFNSRPTMKIVRAMTR